MRLEKIMVETDHPVAADSPDHLEPVGTVKDNSRNARFNEKLFRLFAGREEPLRVLDLGCSGGGFVRDLHDVGCIAVGIEGSDHSRRLRRGEWPMLDGVALFTADITREFTVMGAVNGSSSPLQFELVTAWEVLEHLPESSIPAVCRNIARHVAPHGFVVASTSPHSVVVNGVELHQTQREKGWWLERFEEAGLHHVPRLETYFNGQYIRGPRQGDPESFHLVLARDPAALPAIPTLSPQHRALDVWLGSRPYRLTRLALGLDEPRP